MEIQYVKEFIALAQYGNYLSAAEELFISQSSLSKHIMSLEKEFGFPLFNRTTRKVHLTQFGKAFLPYAQRMVDADTEFRNEISTMEKEVTDSVRLGVIPAFMAYHIEDSVIKFRSKYPQYPITMVEGANEQLVQQLKDGTCNLILLRSFGEPPSGDFVSIPLLSDHIALVIAAGSIFDDGRESVTWKELEEAELITSTSTRQDAALKEFTKRNNIRLNVVSKLSRTPSIIEMLHKGIGNAALLNRYVTKMYVSDPKIRILDITPTLSNYVFLVYMKERPLTNAMRNFIDIALEHASTGES